MDRQRIYERIRARYGQRRNAARMDERLVAQVRPMLLVLLARWRACC